jgi:cysteine protease ATG4
MGLDLLDPSLAIGFYCRNKGELFVPPIYLGLLKVQSNLIYSILNFWYADDFNDFCSRASELAEKANGAPLFTVVQSVQPSKQMYDQHDGSGCSGDGVADDIDAEDLDGSGETGEDEWQIL